MTRRQNQVLLSIPSIQECLLKHESCYREVEGFVDQVAVFQKLSTKAQSMRQRSTEPARPKPDQPDLSEALIEAILVASGPLEAWGAIIGDEVLRSQASAKKSELRAMGAGLIGHATAVEELGRQSIAQGASYYGLSQEMLDLLHRRIDAFEAAPDQGSARLQGAVDRLCYFLRDVMDPLVRSFLISAPEFYAQYRAARKGRTAPDRETVTAEGDAVLSA